MSNDAAAVDRGALVGAMIAAAFGAAWSLWAATGLSGMAATGVRVAGIMIALVIIFACARLYRSSRHQSPASSGSMFASTAYRVIVVLEVIAIVVGNLALNASGHQEYIIAWVAAVVGVHFLGFGRLFWIGFYWLGSALFAAAVSGTIVGLAGGGAGRIVVVTGLVAATSLFIAGMSTVLRARTVPVR